MRFYDVFAHIHGLRGWEARRTFPSDQIFSEIWAWGGGTRGKGSAVLEAWMLGGLEVCFYDVFEHIQSLRCVLHDVFAHIHGLGGQEFSPARPVSGEIWVRGGGTRGKGSAVLEAWMLGDLEVCFYDVSEHIQSLRCVFYIMFAHIQGLGGLEARRIPRPI